MSASVGGSQPDRLVDYFVVAAYDKTRTIARGARRAHQCHGQVIQRFPTKDWPDAKFIDGLEHFCQPNGWKLYTSNFEPKFFISVLTDEMGRRHYCACLTFSEAISRQSLAGSAKQGESAGVGGSDEGDDEVEDHLEQRSRDFVNARLQQDQGHGHPYTYNYIGGAQGHQQLNSISSPGVSFPAVSGHEDIMFAPKCLLLLSRHDYPEVLRNILCVIYTVYNECLVGVGGEKLKLENLIGQLLGHVKVPASNGDTNRQNHSYFSLGASDKIMLQPPLNSSMPVTGDRVAHLFLQLGIRNVIELLMACLTEQKILFFSQSFARLTDGCLGLISLMFPMRYSHVFIPILPSSLIEVLSTPTPFIIGIHAAHKPDMSDLLDVIMVDLDGGAITIPENLKLYMANQTLTNKLRNELSVVLKPDLQKADLALTEKPLEKETTSLFMLDKNLRAVILRFFARLLSGYRSCLTAVRIHPECYITFHKAAFLGLNNVSDYEFLKRFLGSMFFGCFVTERGPPWRRCDVYDILQSQIKEIDILEYEDSTKALAHIHQLGEQLHENEDPSLKLGQCQYQNIPRPAPGAMKRVHQPIFPNLDAILIKELVDKATRMQTSQSSIPISPKSLNETVPMSEVSCKPSQPMISNSARRLQVLRKCIYSIFDNRIAEARKTFPAVLSALKTRQARIALCNELNEYKSSNNQVVLDHQQFEMVVRLINTALTDDSDMDECGIAYKLMPLSSVFCRQLSLGVTQFVYTLIQDHAVWQNQEFWEASFFSDVQIGIEQLYNSNDLSSQDLSTSNSSYSSTNNQRNSSQNADSNDITLKEEWSGLNSNSNALRVAAVELSKWNHLDEQVKSKLAEAEEKVVFSHIFDYTNRMINLLCPMEVSKANRRIGDAHDMSASNSIANSVAESDSIDAESGFEDQEHVEKGENVAKFVLRFADKVCSETRITEAHIKSVNQMIRGAVPMHIETLEDVTAQALKLPNIFKARIVAPPLLPREEMITPNGLRAYLISDGREQQLSFLPAEGALFLTTYRIIFRGIPLSADGSETTVTRFFPISTLTKEKRFTINEYLVDIQQQIKEGFQLRSNTFQLLRLAFDDEVHIDEIEKLRRNIQELRYPQDPFHLFAFRASGYERQSYVKNKQKAKNATIRGIKSTIKSVSQAAGLRQNKPGFKTTLRIMNSSQPDINQPFHSELNERNLNFDPSPESSIDRKSSKNNGMFTMSGMKTLEQHKKTSYYMDWQRIGLLIATSDVNGSSRSGGLAGPAGNQGQAVRITKVNCTYSVAQSYPSLFIVPANLTDDAIKRYSRFHRQSRFPIITWKHRYGSNSLLLRGATFHGRGVIGMIRKTHEDMTAESSEKTSTIEAEKFFTAIVRSSMILAGPDALNKNQGMLESYSSDNQVMASHPTLTPQMSKRGTTMMKIQDSIPMVNFGRLTLGGSNRLGLNSNTKLRGSQQSLTSIGSSKSQLYMEKAQLYVLVQLHVKSLRLDPHLKVEFVPLETIDSKRIRASFKKLMRACMSSSSNLNEQTYYKTIESSEWLQGLQNVMQTAGVVIDLMDTEKASVMICLEDGWDLTCQISSIAQLCMDPFYRTLKGFRVLIEKEWLAFGHRFNYRSNLMVDVQDSANFTPYFLQFLDIVHQIHSQFPMAFEFNQYYLRYLAYHHLSCRFDTFVFDNEYQRVQTGCHSMYQGLNPGEFGRMDANRSSSTSAYMADAYSDDEGVGLATGGARNLTLGDKFERGVNSGKGINLFNYIEMQSNKSPVFFNFLYSPDLQHSYVLRPHYKVSDLRIWSYYYSEELKMGPSNYEFDLLNQYDGPYASATDQLISTGNRDCLTTGYDVLEHTDLSAFNDLLIEIGHLESQLGHVPQPWQMHWDQVDSSRLTAQAQAETPPLIMRTPSVNARYQSAIAHKSGTLEILLKGRMGSKSNANESAGDNQQNAAYANYHKFEKYNYTTPSTCDFCSGLLWGPRTGLKCNDCGYNCHEKCKDNAPKACAKKFGAVPQDKGAIGSKPRTSDVNLREPNPKDTKNPRLSTRSNIPPQENDASFPWGTGRQPNDKSDENSQIVYQGYLYKQVNMRELNSLP